MVIELIAKDKNGKFQFQGRCKLTINSISKFLLVEPFEEFKMISSSFKWKMVAQKNILFVFAEHCFQDFALIFGDLKKCKKVYNILIKKCAIAGNKELIAQRFLSSIFNEISGNNESNLKMKEIFLKWIKFFNGKEKEELIQTLKDYTLKKNVVLILYKLCNVYDLFCSNAVEKNIRKRKAKDISRQGQFFERSNPQIPSEIIEAPNFEVLKYGGNGISKRKLTVFPKTDKKFCYEYFWWKTKQCFICNACLGKRKYLTAKIIKRNGKDVVQLNETHHACKLKEYKGIITKPFFEIVSYERRGVTVKGFILFLDSSRRNCYEYFWMNRSKVYCCCGCNRKHHKNRADICQKDDGTEFVTERSNKHVCEPRKFNPEKYAEKKIIEADNFKIFKHFQNEIDRSKLVIFSSPDKTFCYEYFWFNARKCFCCYACFKKHKSVIANVFQHSNGREYLKLSNKKHICEPREYDPKKFEAIKKEIIESPNFKIFKYKHNGILVSKLAVFCETNKNLCYEYYWNKISQIYFCTYCPKVKQVTATLSRNEDYLTLSQNQHICDLHEFDPDKYKDDVIVEKSMYEIISSALERSKHDNLVIFTSEEKQYYYKFVYSNQKKYFYCSRCFALKIYITATIQNEGKENEFAYVSNQKHICEPFESLINGNIVQTPNYQLIKRKHNSKIVQHMAVFTNDDKSECYEYRWFERKKFFACWTCTHKHKNFVSAKMFKNYANKKCIELSPKLHKCKPIKFVPENITAKIVKLPDFKLYEIIFRQKSCKRLAIFDPKNRNMGYIYSLRPQGNYQCLQCACKKKYVIAGVRQNESGENFVELNETEHVCEMRKL